MPVIASSNMTGPSNDGRLHESSDSSRVAADKDVTVPAACSCRSRNTSVCETGDACAQASGNTPGESANKAIAVESSGCDAKTVVHLHGTDDRLVDNSADIETAGDKWQNIAGDEVSAHDNRSSEDRKLIEENIHSQPVYSSVSPSSELLQRPQDHKLIQESVRSQTVGNSAPPSGETLPRDLESGVAAEVAVNRRRRISAARSALYHRLLSSEVGGSSDVDAASDIFDEQSLCSDDGDSDDSNSDHSYLVSK